MQQELVEAKQLEFIHAEAGQRSAESELDFMADAKQVMKRSEGGRKGGIP
jgi:hypothetical protein